MPDSDPGKTESPKGSWTTQELIRRIRDGDEAARDALFRRYYPRLTRIAHGRLPAAARGLSQTADLVQNTFCRALNRLHGFEHRHEGAFLAWLRTIMRSEVLDQFRRAKRRPVGEPAPGDLLVDERTPLEVAVEDENREIYERALKELPDPSRQAVMLRLEYGMTYVEIAEALGRPSPNATRMMIHRALLQMARSMRELAERK